MLESKGLKTLIIAVLCCCVVDVHAFQPDEPLPWGGRITRADECSLEETFVLAQGNGFIECLRYFAAGLKKTNPVAILVMEGDRDNDVGKQVSTIANNTPILRAQYANTLLARTNAPVVLLSRPGTFGSTGNHRHKRTLNEFAPISAAMDGLAQRYGIKRWVVIGHSGGGTAAAALLTLGRTDLECVIVTSGAFDLVERANRYRQNRGLPIKPFTDLTGTVHPYDPLYQLSAVKQDNDRQVILLGNPQDKVTPFEFQQKFADALRELGHNVRIDEVDARPPNFHDLVFGSGLKAANQCLGAASGG